LRKTIIGGISCVGKDYLFDKVRDKIGVKNIFYFHFSKNMRFQSKIHNIEFKPENFGKLANIVLSNISDIDKNLIINGHYSIPNYSNDDDNINSFREDDLYEFGINNFILIEADPYLIQKRREKKFSKRYSIDNIKYELYTERDKFYKIGGKTNNIIVNDDIENSGKKLVNIINKSYN